MKTCSLRRTAWGVCIVINIVMLAKNRPLLTHQALWSLAKHTDVDYTIVIIDDGSDSETRQMLRMFAGTHRNAALLCNETSKGITGQARNLGVYWTEKYWKRGTHLYLSDNDVCFLDGWASRMVGVLSDGYKDGLRLLGGQRHPYHQPNRQFEGWVETDAVAGYSQLMRWDVWDSWGPLDAHAPGVCQSEDHAFCQRIREHYRVGYITPPVVVDCGLTTTDGSPAIGREAKVILPGLIYE